MEKRERILFEYDRASDVAGRYEAPEAVRDLIEEETTPGALLAALEERELWAEALHFLCQAWPAQRRVWWASQTLHQLLGETLDGPDREALDLAECWAVEPADERRLRLRELAEELGKKTPPAILGLAVFFAADSMNAADAPVAAPPPALAPQMTATAVDTACLLARAPGGPDLHRAAALAQARDLDDTRPRWEEVTRLLMDDHLDASGPGPDPAMKKSTRRLDEQARAAPSRLDDSLLRAEMDRVFGPAREREEEQKQQVEENERRRQEAENKAAELEGPKAGAES